MALVFGVIFTVPLISGSTWQLTKAGLRPLALPIILILWIMIAASLYQDLPKLASTQIPQLVPETKGTATTYSWETAFDSLGNGFSGIFFVTKPLTGYLSSHSLATSSPSAFPPPSAGDAAPPGCSEEDRNQPQTSLPGQPLRTTVPLGRREPADVSGRIPEAGVQNSSCLGDTPWHQVPVGSIRSSMDL
ncbi:urea transporter [Streptomyces anulatus]